MRQRRTQENRPLVFLNTYYIIGENQSTFDRYEFHHKQKSYHTRSTKAGDGAVLSYSASINDMYPSKTIYASEQHINLVCSRNLIKAIKDLINGEFEPNDHIRYNSIIKL